MVIIGLSDGLDAPDVAVQVTWVCAAGCVQQRVLRHHHPPQVEGKANVQAQEQGQKLAVVCQDGVPE